MLPAPPPVPLESLPVFPLPNTVLFPGRRLALHIFEPRYRQMMRDALAGDPYFVVALIQGDPVAEPSTFAPLATVGRIVAHERLADGRFHVLLEGVTRVQCEEIASPQLYRRVRCTALPEPPEDAEVPATERAALLSLVGLVMRAVRTRAPERVFNTPPQMPAAQLAFAIADGLVPDAPCRQRILAAETVLERVARTTEALAQTLGEIAPSVRGTPS
jgi:Lon protease-like protein